MGNHFHLLVKMFPEHKFTDEDIQKRYEEFYGDDVMFAAGWIPSLRVKLSSLSEFVREIKVGFARFYNKRHNRRGYFWGDRFKSVIVENGETLINCLAYIPYSGRFFKKSLKYKGSHDLVKICSHRIKWCYIINILLYIRKNNSWQALFKILM